MQIPDVQVMIPLPNEIIRQYNVTDRIAVVF